LLRRKALAELSKFFCLRLARRPGDYVAEQTADDVRLVRLELEGVHQAAGDSGEGVAVEIAERGEPMTLTAQVRRFIQEHLTPIIHLPKLTGAVVAVAGRFVDCPFGLTQSGVCGGHELPVEQLKPRSFHAAA